MKSHESIESERFAKAMHWLAFGLSALSTIWGVGGMFWHAWGIRQHVTALKYMKHDREHGL